uniref:Adenylosuccinate synthetase n=1 Tax=Stomoxys calcitrans TaxID=35570 RepID=A0A1I8NUU0_STOCA
MRNETSNCAINCASNGIVNPTVNVINNDIENGVVNASVNGVTVNGSITNKTFVSTMTTTAIDVNNSNVNGEIKEATKIITSHAGNGVVQSPKRYESQVTVVLGAQWGDEGKGKVVDMLAREADIVCRCQGGSNADHIVVVNGTEFVFHLLPCGIVNEKCVAVIGNGVVIHLPSLLEELSQMQSKGLAKIEQRLIISDRAHLVFDFHQEVDGMQEAEREGTAIGTTRKGIGPTYSSKATRNGIRVGELLGDFNHFIEKFKTIVGNYQRLFPSISVDINAELKRYKTYAECIRPYVKDSVYFLHAALLAGKIILVEGANAGMLDIDFGTYPYVTSSNCSIGGVLTGLGLPAQAIGEVIGVVKSYTTRVGDGPFPTELSNNMGEELQKRGSEVGFTTNRKRRCGWLDIPLLRYTALVNGYTCICLTKLDILDTLDEIKVAIAYKHSNGAMLYHIPGTVAELQTIEVEYAILPGWKTCTQNIRTFEQLPENAQKYVSFVENKLEVPIRWVGVGRGRECIINVQKIR